ncbi:hypothetical protein ACH4E5_40890 [Streptomyces afghaniensis]|uniref:hypothetical protein n=1 Tax=Streptomyces afghaniensis TaxID=66865 RepID=UPI0037A83248
MTDPAFLVAWLDKLGWKGANGKPIGANVVRRELSLLREAGYVQSHWLRGEGGKASASSTPSRSAVRTSPSPDRGSPRRTNGTSKAWLGGRNHSAWAKAMVSGCQPSPKNVSSGPRGR